MHLDFAIRWLGHWRGYQKGTSATRSYSATVSWILSNPQTIPKLGYFVALAQHAACLLYRCEGERMEPGKILVSLETITARLNHSQKSWQRSSATCNPIGKQQGKLGTVHRYMYIAVSRVYGIPCIIIFLSTEDEFWVPSNSIRDKPSCGCLCCIFLLKLTFDRRLLEREKKGRRQWAKISTKSLIPWVNHIYIYVYIYLMISNFYFYGAPSCVS